MSGKLNRRVLILAIIAVVAAIPRLILGASQFIEYDGYWHIFIAQQDKWANFWHDIYVNAHPPLFFLLMKAILFVTRARGLLVYRSISILTGVASVYVVGRIAWKVTGSEVRAYQAALVYGVALPSIIISCEVRSYMLSAFFVMLSFACLVDLTGAEPPPHENKLRAGFAVWTILACLSHYYAFFYAAAAMLLLVARRGFRWKAEAATCLPIAAAILALYFSHAQTMAVALPHLLPYYLNGAGHESVLAFLMRNWKNFLNLFLPFTIQTNAVALGVLIAGIGTGIWLARTLTIRITALMLGMIALAALAGKYPFGGDLRQQFLLFPFLVLSAAILVERLAGLRIRSMPVYGGAVVNAVLICGIVWITTVRYEQYPKVPQNVGAAQMRIFNRLEPAPKAVFLDQFNLILFYIFHNDWTWKTVEPPQPIPDTDVYRLQRGRDEMIVFRDKTDWNIDATDPAIFTRLAQCVRTEKLPEISVFSSRQSPPREPYTELKPVRRDLALNADNAGICTERESVNAYGWHATFRPNGCRYVVQLTGIFDNGSEAIDYSGNWIRGDFHEAASGSTTFANTRGASLELDFEGNEITWVYARAFNRGIAEVKLDGQSRGEFDLYSPQVAWQSRETFSFPGRGRHTFEVIVTGKKNAVSKDEYVDVDELIAR